MSRLMLAFICVCLSLGIVRPIPVVAADSTRNGLLLQVVILPKDPTSTSLVTALQPLADSINQSPVYAAWVNGSKACPIAGGCSLANAQIFIRASQDLTDPQNPKYSLLSIDVQGGGKIGSVNGLTASDIAKLTVANELTLLGTPVLSGSQLAVLQGYQQFVQLVPEQPVGSTDPDYAPYLAELLARRAITSVRSGYTSTQLGSAPNSAICSSGQKYLVYSVTMTKNQNIITGFTRVGANFKGIIVDCVTMTTTAFAGEDKRQIPTTSASLLSYSALLAFFIPKFSWVPIGQGSLAFSKIVDADPDNSVIKGDVALYAMQRGVDDMCSVLSASQQYRSGGPSATVAPTPASPPHEVKDLPGLSPFSLPTVNASPANFASNVILGLSNSTPSQGGAPATSASASNPLDLSGFVGPNPPPLECNPPAAGNILSKP